MIKKLTPEMIRLIHNKAIERYGGLQGEHNSGLIDYMADKPFMTVFGEELYPELFVKAAVYFHGLAERQYFADANKRTAYACMLTFLDMNGYIVTVDDDTLYEVALKVATKQIELEELAKWIEQHSEYVGEIE
jgi:death-on-curing protein